jgi:hypothetical protein
MSEKMTKERAALHLDTLRLLGMASCMEEPEAEIVWVAFDRRNLKALKIAVEELRSAAEKEKGHEAG